MKCNLKNGISQVKPKMINAILNEAYKNLVEMIARTKMGDVKAANEFSELYCMNIDVLQWQLDNTKQSADADHGMVYGEES